MNLEDLSQNVQDAFMLMLKAALCLESEGLNEDQFCKFAKGIWETMKLNDRNESQEIIGCYSARQVTKFIENSDIPS